MVDQYLLHIPNILLHHDDHVIIIMKEEEKGIFAREGDFGPHNFLQSFLGAGWYYDDCRKKPSSIFSARRIEFSLADEPSDNDIDSNL